MTPYFDPESRVLVLDSCAVSWVGTPFRANSSVRGEGASCVGAVAGVLSDVGFKVPPFPTAPPSWSRHQTRSLMELWMDDHPNTLAPVDCGRAKPGDVVGFRVGLCIHHLGLILPQGRFFQCNESMGCSIVLQAERQFRQRLSRIWRPIEL